MEVIENLLGRWVVQYRWIVILLTLILVALAGSGGKYLAFTNNYRVFFSADNPELLAFESLEKQFSKNDNVLFVLEPKNGNAFTTDALVAIEELTEKAWQIPYSSRVNSLSNFQHTEAEEDDLVVRDLYTDAGNLSAEEIARIKEISMNEPLLVNRLISDRGHVAGVNVTILLPGEDENKETPEVVSFARNIAAEIQQAHPDITVYISGMIMMNNAFGESSRGDMAKLVPISFGIMIIMLVLLTKSFSGTLLTTLVIVFAILVGMGLGGYIGYPISPPSASAPTMILTIAIANSVHVIVTFLHGLQYGKTKVDAIKESIRVNLQPVFLASLTTCLGFLSMNFSDAPPFQHLGNFVAMGVACAFILSMTFLPAMMSLFPFWTKQIQNENDPLMARFGELVVRRRKLLLWSMVILSISLISFIPKNELNDIFVNYFDETVKYRTDSDYTVNNLTGVYNIEYSLSSGTSGGINDPVFLKEVAAFSTWYRSQPETIHVETLTDIMTRLNKNMHGDDPDFYKLPDERNLAAQYLLLYEMSLPYGLDLNNQIDVDKASIRLIPTLKTLSSNELIHLNQRAYEWLKTNTTHINLSTNPGSGTGLMFANIGKRNIKSMLLGTTLALIMISMILIFAFRSLKIGLISLLPNLIPAGLGFGLWGLFVGEVGLALSVVTGMTLGIVVDDTVHFLSKYLRARREGGLSSAEAVVYAFSTVGRALVITSVVLIAGFLVLSLSSFELNSGMGLLTAIVIAFALLADFLLLPPLLMKFEEKSHVVSLNQVDTGQWKKLRIVLYLVSFFVGTGVGLYNPLISLIMKEGGQSDIAIGANSSLFFLFIILVTPVASYFSRNHSIRFTIITGLAVAGITSSLFPYFTTLTQWSALRAGLGIGIGLYMVGGQVAINAFAIESQRTFVVGLHALSFGIGMGVGPLIGAWLYLIDAKLAFLFCGVILSIGIPVLIKWLPSITAEKINRINQKQVRSISISLHAVFAYGVAEATLLSLFPVFMIDRGYSVTIIGFTLSIFVIGGILSTLPLTKSADKVGQERVLAYCALFGVLGSLLLAWSPHISVLLLASMIAGASLGPIFALAMAIIGRKLSKQDLPSGSAFFTASFSLGAMCAPWLVAIIMKNFGSVHIFTLTSLLFASLLFRLLPTRRFA